MIMMRKWASAEIFAGVGPKIFNEISVIQKNDHGIKTLLLVAHEQ